jgi:hypothetical protein
VRNGVLGDPLIGRQAIRYPFDRLTDGTIYLGGATTDLIQIGHDYRDEPAVPLQHADLADDGVDQVRFFDLLGLYVLASCGDD